MSLRPFKFTLNCIDVAPNLVSLFIIIRITQCCWRRLGLFLSFSTNSHRCTTVNSDSSASIRVKSIRQNSVPTWPSESGMPL